MIIAVGIKIIYDAIYEVAGAHTTNWEVSYNVVNYVTLSACIMHVGLLANSIDILKKHNKFIEWMSTLFGVLYASYAAIELSYINKPYDVYISAMMEGYFKLNYALFVALSLGVYCVVFYIKKKYRYVWI